MKLLRHLILLFTTVAWSLLSVAQIYTFKNFNYEEGINLVSILTVEEFNDGDIWFGTDGAGLMRYDGKTFDYLEEVQGRTNRHVNYIFFNENEVLFSTLYRGAFSLQGSRINNLKFTNRAGRTHAVFSHNNRHVILQDSGLKVYNDSVLVHEKTNYPFNPKMQFYGSIRCNNELFVFSSDRNYCVKGNNIINLHEWLGIEEREVRDYVTAFKKEDSLVFVDKYLKNTLTIPFNNFKQKKIIKKRIRNSFLLRDEHVIKWDKRDSLIAYLTNKGRIVVYELHSSKYHVIENNSDGQIIHPTDILIDRNRDIWVTTISNGAYRVSLEPFTKLSSNPIFKEPHISFIGKTNDGNMVVTVSNKGTYIGKSDFDGKETKEDAFVFNEGIFVSSITHLENVPIVAAKDGVYYIDNKNLEEYVPLSGLKGERVSLVLNAFDYLWYAVESKGLFRKDLKTEVTYSYSTAPAYFYNAISTPDSSALYFGTNYGVHKYDKESKSLIKLSRRVGGNSLGAYVGNSVIDSHGTIWFSFDEGLLGITKDNKKVSITAEYLLPSLLIYTLNSDEYGHLIIGSNKGITVIRVSEEGQPLSSKTFNKESGFYGHETHMRSSYQSTDGSILLGTLSGLVLVRPEYFVKKVSLNKPIIYSFKNKNVRNLVKSKASIVLKSEDNNLLIEFKSVNTKSNFVSYSYKLEGTGEGQKGWSDWSPKQEAIFNNLDAGSYNFKVKSSIDGENESEISTLSFDIDVPFYKNKWFIIIVISLVVLINIILLDRVSNFNRENIILSRDVVANRAMAKSILIFGAVTNTLGHLFAPRIDETINYHDFSALAVGVIVLGLYFFIRFVDNTLRKTGIYLAFGFLILLGYNMTYTYMSDIHPFYFTATLLVTFVAPYTLKRLRSAVFVSLAMGILAVITMFLVDEAKYNQYLFLIGIAIAGFLMIFKTYLRNNSLEQLIFTSGIVNKGNALVVAFDKKGKVSYASENIELLLGMKQSLKGENVLFLNQYQPPNNEMKNFNDEHLISEFKEGAIFVTAFITSKNEVVYYQWSCKQFSDEVRVILGQDVTEKINLENYYELIVRNADDLIFQTDTNGNFTFVNEKCTEVFERTKSELLKLSILNVVDPPFHKRVRSFFDNNLQERNKGGYKEYPIVTPEGEIKWLGQNIRSIRKPGAENVVTGFLCLARDITEARNANAIIKEQNQDITSSINYARRIQFNMLPRSSEFDELFKEHFILYRPKDIVSGDFFWLKKVEGKTILILSDCTGHGVPGSFMTILGINILNQVILEAKTTDPGEILNQLDVRLTEVLPRDGQNRIQDGMEVVVCVFDNESNEVEYALAGGRFLIKNNREEKIEVIKGETKHIGDVPLKDTFSYETSKLLLTEDDVLYLFSDGYPDQFGGEKNKKLTIKKFLSLIDVISYQPMNEQNIILQEYFTEWIGDLSQTDDITVIGVKGKG